MSILLSFSSINIVPYSCSRSRFRACGSKLQTSPVCPPRSCSKYTRYRYKIPCISWKTISGRPSYFSKVFLARNSVKTGSSNTSTFSNEEEEDDDDEEMTIDFDWVEDEVKGSPWEGAVVYKRNPSILHSEYCTTLERLGLGKLSSEISRLRASSMGLRVTKAVKDHVDGTPVLVSVDVTRKKHKLRLDGIIRTVITLGCNRCGQPAAESVFSNFTLLLTEEPIEDPDMINMGVIYGEERSKTSSKTTDFKEDDDDDDATIDLDDRLHFPPEEKTIDISKHIRDMVHLEITINAVCDPRCKGLCLTCGTNLNTSSCGCSERGANEAGYGPLGNLRRQMQRK